MRFGQTINYRIKVIGVVYVVFVGRLVRRLSLAVIVVVLCGLLAPAVWSTQAIAQAGGTPLEGLPAPNPAADSSLQALLTELERSAGTVVAEVGPHTVTWGDIADQIRAMPSIVGWVPFQAVFQRAGRQVLETEALALRGETTGLDKDPIVKRRMRAAADQALATEVLRRSLAPNLTDTALRATYDALVAGKPAPEEVAARVILVDTEGEAMSLIKRLHEGAGFADLARQFSKDGTAPNGGELGYARLDMLSPELGAVIFALAPGQTTEYPVRSHGAWFVIQVEGRRQPAAPSFEAARASLEQDIIHAGTPALMQAALKAAPVVYHGLAGKKADKAP